MMEGARHLIDNFRDSISAESEQFLDDLEAEVETMTARVSELEAELHDSEAEREMLEQKLARAEMTIAELKGEIPWWMFLIDRIDFSLVSTLLFIVFLIALMVD